MEDLQRLLAPNRRRATGALIAKLNFSKEMGRKLRNDLIGKLSAKKSSGASKASGVFDNEGNHSRKIKQIGR